VRAQATPLPLRKHFKPCPLYAEAGNGSSFQYPALSQSQWCLAPRRVRTRALSAIAIAQASGYPSPGRIMGRLGMNHVITHAVIRRQPLQQLLTSPPTGDYHHPARIFCTYIYVAKCRFERERERSGRELLICEVPWS
jgi:hypothetical protein